MRRLILCWAVLWLGLACRPCARTTEQLTGRPTLPGLYRLTAKSPVDELRLEPDGGFSHCVNRDAPPALLEHGSWSVVDGGSVQWLRLDSYSQGVDPVNGPNSVLLLISSNSGGLVLELPSDLEHEYLRSNVSNCPFEPR